jgi:hypothetical protein
MQTTAPLMDRATASQGIMAGLMGTRRSPYRQYRVPFIIIIIPGDGLSCATGGFFPGRGDAAASQSFQKSLLLQKRRSERTQKVRFEPPAGWRTTSPNSTTGLHRRPGSGSCASLECSTLFSVFDRKCNLASSPVAAVCAIGNRRSFSMTGPSARREAQTADVWVRESSTMANQTAWECLGVRAFCDPLWEIIRKVPISSVDPEPGARFHVRVWQ